MAETKVTPAELNNSSSVQSITNTGSAGGTISYINLGGLKILFVVTTYSAAAVSPTVVFPALFSSTPVVTMGTVGSAATTTGQYIVIGSVSSTGFTYYTGTNPQGAFFIAIGS
jgi:hypothetical protein